MSQSLYGKVSAAWRRLLVFADALDARVAVRPRAILWLCLLQFLFLPTRRLGLFTHPNFYAEDAQVWFLQAYSGGWLHSLTLPEGGYLNTLQRLLTGPALLVPFRWAPLVMAVFGLILQILPVPVLLSRRCRNWGPLSVRCMFAALYALFPNGGEIHVVLTNSQWHLALVLVLLAFGEVPTSAAGKVADTAFFLLAGFCGPFGLLLLPFLLVRLFLQRPGMWAALQAIFLVPGALVQLYELTHGPARYQAYLGATVGRFLHILGAEVFIASVLGGHSRLHVPAVAIGLALAVGVSVLVYCLRFAPTPLRYLIVYATALLALALHAPLIAGPKPLWLMLIDDLICRYWFFPGLCFLWSAAWAARSATAPLMRTVGLSVVLLSFVGMVITWRYGNFPDEHFPQYAQQFEAAPPRTHVRVFIYPNAGRYVDLVKR